MWEKKNACRILVGKPEGKRLLENIDIGGRMVSTWILK
jgi:hypothetical protein